MSYSPDSTGNPRRNATDPLTSGSRIPEPRAPKDNATVPPLPDGVTLPTQRYTPEPLTPTEKFEAYHQLNPHVYAALVRLARRYRDVTGEGRQSVQRLVEIARWDEKIRTKGRGDFEINNDFCAFYARLIMLQEADLEDVFQVRRSGDADEWIAAKRRAGRTV